MDWSRQSSSQSLSLLYELISTLVLRYLLIGTSLFFAVLVLGSASGCSRAVFIPEASPIRVGPNCRTKVYLLIDGEWTLSDNSVVIPEGWYCVPPRFVVEDESKEVSPS
jgi:hypothetical protein